MKTSASARHLSLSLLLLSAAGATFAAAAAAAKTVTNNPVAHPTFAVRVVGKGQPMLLIPGLNCPGAMGDATGAHYQAQY